MLERLHTPPPPAPVATGNRPGPRPGPRIALLTGLAGSTAIALWLPGEQGSAAHLLSFVAALGCFAALIAVELRAPWLSVGPVLGLGAALTVLAVVMPPRESQDVWAYAMYGRVAAIHHANPYVVLPRAFKHDPFLRLMSRRWRRTRLVYGPVFLAVAGAIALIGRHDPLATRLGFQVVAALCAAGCGALVWWRTRSAASVAFLALNPLVIVTVINGGHNDALLALLLLAGFLLATRGEEPWAGVVVGVAALVKVSALIGLVAIVLWAWWHRRFLAGLIAGVLGSAVALVGYALFAGSFAAVGRASDFVAPYTIWKLPRIVAQLVARGSAATPAWGFHLYRVAIHAAIPVAVGLIAALIVLRLSRPNPGPAIIAGVVGYLLAAPYALPWYVMIVLPIAAVELRTKESWLAFAGGALLAIIYLVRRAADTGGRTGTLWAQVATVTIVLGMLAILVILLVDPTVERLRPRPQPEGVELPEAEAA